jgi:hypothetical protein
MENPVQLRLGFNAPIAPQRWITGLAGAMVTVTPQDGDNQLAMAYLANVGASAGQGADGVVTVPVSDLRRFASLPDHVTVVYRTPLDVLMTLIERPPASEHPVVLTVESGGRFNLAWFDGRITLNEHLPAGAAPAFIALEIPFVADAATWDELLAASQLPVLLGRARVNLDGFVEVVTSRPQKVEASPLQALFKLDDTHYGVPLAYASGLSDVPGFVWEGRRPAYDQAPAVLPDLGLELSDHARTDLSSLVGRLAASRAEAVVWESGLGRRVFSLAAVASLEAFPLLIVTTPHGIWAWQRHLDLLGRTWSLTHDRADVHIVTYRDLLARRDITSPASMIFDDLDRVPREQRTALRRLDGVLDAYRIACCSTFPEDPAEAVDLMASLRPAEFRSDVPLLARYPLRPEVRAREHVSAYLSRRELGSQAHGFRRSSVEVLEPTDQQVQMVEQALETSGRPMEETLAEGLSVISSGTAASVGPKIARAVEIARAAHREGRSVAVVTRHARTAQMLRIALRPIDVETVERYDERVRQDPLRVVVVTRPDGRLPDLRMMETVVMVDYLWSSLALDSSVGSSSERTGPTTVVQLHLRTPLDDRCALLAARRRELGAVVDPYAGPNTEELAYLLSDRR